MILISDKTMTIGPISIMFDVFQSSWFVFCLRGFFDLLTWILRQHQTRSGNHMNCLHCGGMRSSSICIFSRLIKLTCFMFLHYWCGFWDTANIDHVRVNESLSKRVCVPKTTHESTSPSCQRLGSCFSNCIAGDHDRVSQNGCVDWYRIHLLIKKTVFNGISTEIITMLLDQSIEIRPKGAGIHIHEVHKRFDPIIPQSEWLSR